MSYIECTNCGKSKPLDRFRACPDCREEWRRYSRKPGGPAETIDQLRAENEALRKRLAKYEDDDVRPRL